MDKKRILAIDDNAVNLATIEKALQGEYEVIPMISGRRAIRFLMCEKVDLILLDVQMPTMDGFETLTEIRKTENGVTVPVIFLTAMKDRQTVIRGSKLGIMDYITKPFDISDLKTRIEYVYSRVEGAALEENKLVELLMEIISVLEDGKTKQGIAKIEYLLGFQLEDEIFKRLKNALEVLEKGNLDSGIRKVKRALQVVESSFNDLRLSISDRELYFKLLCVRAYMENCKTKNAIDECEDILQRFLPDAMKTRIQDIEHKLLIYDDDEAKTVLFKIIDELGKNIH